MRTNIIILILVFIYTISDAQSIYVENGQYFFRSRLETPIKYFQKTNYDSQELFYWTVGYEHRLKSFYTSSISIDYSYCFQGPSIVINNPESSFGGLATGIIENHSFTSGLRIPKFIIKNRLHFSAGIFLKIIYVKRTWPDGSNGYFVDYPYSGYISYKAYPGIKIQPEIRFALDLRFLWRMHFYINTGFTKGFSKWQEVSFVHSLDGVKQPTATAYIDGTGFNLNIGLKYDFVFQVK